MTEAREIKEGQIITGALFNEPMRVETVATTSPTTWVLGILGNHIAHTQ
jgi:hypothetical protein